MIFHASWNFDWRIVFYGSNWSIEPNKTCSQRVLGHDSLFVEHRLIEILYRTSTIWQRATCPNQTNHLDFPFSPECWCHSVVRSFKSFMWPFPMKNTTAHFELFQSYYTQQTMTDDSSNNGFSSIFAIKCDCDCDYNEISIQAKHRLSIRQHFDIWRQLQLAAPTKIVASTLKYHVQYLNVGRVCVCMLNNVWFGELRGQK